MFEILDSTTGAVIDHANGRLNAMRRADALQFSTLRPMHLRAAKADATLAPTPAWAFETLADAFDAGAVTLPW